MTTLSEGGRVLIVDDEPSMGEMLQARLSRRGFEATSTTTPDEALAELERSDFDVILTDLNLRGASGLDLCAQVVANRPDIPVVVFTAFGSMETAIAAIRAGAYDFVTKPVDVEALVVVLQRAIQHRVLRQELKRLRSEARVAHRFEELKGRSPVMETLLDVLDRIGPSDASVLVTGESGTGKDLVARALHARGPRAAGPFVAVDFAAVPEALLESELFGHVRGATPDAHADRTGLIVQASGGTLFLDGIGDLPARLQRELVRALQDRRVRPVGATTDVPVDVRIVAASSRDLEAAVEEGRFREDLLFRINVVHVEVPPLRARGTDVLVLAQDWLERCASRSGKHVQGLSSAAAEKLLEYSWPGNVRELQNCIERAVVLARFAEITVDDLPEKIRAYKRSHVLVSSDDPGDLVPMEEVERRYILRVLEAVGGNKRQAARILGFDRKTLYRKLERYGSADAQAAP